MSTDSELTNPAFWDERYRTGSSPWDQGTVAPEVLAFVSTHPGNGDWALDIGCGTGTHGQALAHGGYRVLGIDLSHVALGKALAKARADDLHWFGVQGSATQFDCLAVSPTVALDVGCLHTLPGVGQVQYAAALENRLALHGFYLLYTVHPRTDPDQGGPPGVDPEQIQSLFAPYMELEWSESGQQGVRQANWWLWRRTQSYLLTK